MEQRNREREYGTIEILLFTIGILLFTIDNSVISFTIGILLFTIEKTAKTFTIGKTAEKNTIVIIAFTIVNKYARQKYMHRHSH